MDKRSLYRCRKDKMIFGICGGLADYFNIDSSFVRIVTIILWVFTGFLPLFFLYLLSAVLIPAEPRGLNHEPYRRFFRSRNDRKIAGICGGLARVFQIDSTLIRFLSLFLCLITGILPFLFVYIAAWILLPERP